MPKIYLKDLSCYEASYTSISPSLQNLFIKNEDGEVFLNFCKVENGNPSCLLPQSFGGVIELGTAKVIADILNNFDNYIEKIKQCQY